jgi:hypothetical protein
MAKSQLPTTISPVRMSLGQLVLSQDIAAIGALLNFVFGRRRQQHIGLITARDGWSSGSEVGTLRATADGTQRTIIDTDIWVDRDAARAPMTFGAECSVLAANTVRVSCRLTGGLGTVTVAPADHANADNGTEKTAAITTSSVTNGGEWMRVEILLQRITGAGTTNQIIELRLEEDEVTSSLPDPDND